ncbi:NTP transferase domain-containing protein [Candidatus Mycosynbacter amalyticus]|uniref:UTP--glucose-1-phosphate uridylyltransferase n=1 Tax=Candidatus Mycosynbacter amalyticus TaxID=2665156 RepID=A0A857MK18_9BACT|nr:NTP transferase domain-containing protein [Candidatus Mycosynbacter amalyticus]
MIRRRDSLKKPTKAIICAAGLGTRFLPQTKAMPKEMLPIIDRPVIQLIVEEAVAAGVTEIIMVTGSTKRAIEDHFDRSDELEAELREKGKDDKADEIKAVAELANFVYVRQKGTPKGNARPVLNAQHLIDDDEPFFVFFADDFFRSEVPRAKQLLDAYEATGKSVISLIEVDKADADKYGMAAIKDEAAGGAYQVTELIEKPGADNTPSNLASVGGYLLTPDILPIIADEKPDKNGEITLADSINELAQQDAVYGRIIDGIWHDTGNQLKYIKAVVDLALERDDFGPELAEYLRERLK